MFGGLVVIVPMLIAAYLFMENSKPAQPQDMRSRVVDAIRKGIVIPLRLPNRAVDILYAQAVLETGKFTGKAFAATNSLFNRHKGSGRGEWTGRTFYANPGDADLRVYSDVYQSARDMAQLLQDGLYRNALSALRLGSSNGYYDALSIAGFAADMNYAANLKRTLRVVA